MNAKSLLNWGILDWIKDFFLGILDNIPRLVYFFFAAFASGVDALQNLLRKLAGLDVYYTKVISDNKLDHLLEGDFGYQDITIIKKGYSARWGQDPLTEFIYGTLGIGDSASAYRSLTTVFWSLSIFAIIILVLSTMVAMIKSHYSEDYQNTNPWKYIYTAIKAVLTYAVMPVVVVLGMQISHFILQTLDNITAGTDASKVEAMFGRQVAKDNFKTSIYAEGTPQQKETYTHYDYFGAGGPTTTTTFGGMLFNAAAYSANRLRSGTISLSEMEATKVFASSNCPDYAKLTEPEDKQNYAADQVDFAFSNNLKWTNSKTIWTLTGWFKNVRYVEFVDFMSIKVMSSFSKYNITAVWMFYDLWQFQFIVAFGGGVTAVGILLSVILGMMSRLIKGAALFLIYPPLIALAPLDNFKAFKSWGTQFMQQVLMAYGAVIGMNILMLVLPLVQNISWYGPGMGIIDAIVNMIILIVGLLMTKDFIAIVSGFIGGADANSIGQGLKADGVGAIKKGVGMTKTFAGTAARASIAGVRIAGATGKAIVNRAKNGSPDKTGGADKPLSKRAQTKYDIDALNTAGDIEKRETDFQENLAKKKSEELSGARVLDAEIGKMTGFAKEADIDASNLTAAQKNTAREALKARISARNSGASVEEQEAAARGIVEDSLKNQMGGKDKDGNYISKFAALKGKQDANEAAIEEKYKGKTSITEEEKAKLERVKKIKEIDAQNTKDGKAPMYSQNKDGKYISPGKQKLNDFFDGKKAGQQLGDAFLKSINEAGSAFGLDKVLNGLKEDIGKAFSVKGGIFESDSSKKSTLSGDALAKEHAAAAKTNAENQLRAQEKTNALLERVITSNQELKKASESNLSAINKLSMVNKDNSSKK